METTTTATAATAKQSSSEIVKSDRLRDLAFHELETSHATLRKLAGLMDAKNPLVRHMSQVLGVAENSLRILEANPGGEIKLLPGPIHGDEPETERDAEASVVESDENGSEPAPEDKKTPPDFAIAHARRLNHCKAKKLGCDYKVHGNSIGRHQQLCEYYQTGRLLEAGYKIESFEDFLRALKKESKGKTAASPETLKASIEREHGTYRKLLGEVRKAMRANKEWSAA